MSSSAKPGDGTLFDSPEAAKARDDEEFFGDLPGSWVIHLPTLVVGRVKARWRAGMYVSPVNGIAVPDEVVELESGHALLAKRDSFVKMGNSEIRFHDSIQEGLSALVAIAARNGQSSGVDMETGYSLTVAALRAQLRALEAG